MRLGLSSAQARGYDFLVGVELIGEIGHANAEGLRVIVGTMPRALLRAKRAGDMVIGKSNVGAVLGVERYLKEVRKRAAIRVRASGAIGAHRSRMNDVVAGRVLCEAGDRGVAVDALCGVDIPLRPAIRGSVGAGGLHHGRIVGITRQVGAEPSHHDVAISIRCDPGKHIGFSHC